MIYYYSSYFAEKKEFMSQVYTKNGFSVPWKRVRQPKIIKSAPFPMREWQKDAYSSYKNERLLIVNGPTGSGKTALICCMSEYKLRNDSSLRTIIAVPQTIIAGGFTRLDIQSPDWKKSDWRVSDQKNNLCLSSDDSTTKRLREFLSEDNDIIGERTLICTHATLSNVFHSLTTRQRNKLFRNVIVWIDEAHHVQNQTIDVLGKEIIDSNRLGDVVTYLINSKNNIHVGLTTATFFRGDKLTLLTDKQSARFKRYDLPYDKYMEQLQYLESFSFDFKLCGTDYMKGIDSVLAEKRAKDIIWIPHVNSKYSSKDKFNDRDKITKIIHKRYGKDVQILDLIDDSSSTRSHGKKIIRKVLNNKILGQNYDAVLALGMFKEGANWDHAERGIIVAPRNSLVDTIQMIGRLFRDARDKKHVQVVQILPFAFDQSNKEQLKTNLNDFMKAIMASLMLEDIIRPVTVKNTSNNNPKSGKNSTSVNWLNQLMPDTSMQIDLRDDVSKEILTLIDSDPRLESDIHLLFEEYMKMIPSVLKNYGIKKHHEEIGQQLWLGFVRRTVSLSGLDVSKLDFDMIQEVMNKKRLNPISCLLNYTSGTCTIDTFRELRYAMDSDAELFEKQCKEIERYLSRKVIK